MLTSYAGVTGTVIGTAATSIVATVATALYRSSLARGRTAFAAAAANGRLPVPHLTTPRLPTPPRPVAWFRRLPRPAAIAVGSVLAFGLAIGTVSAVEAIAGGPLATVVAGRDTGGGTSFGRSVGGKGDRTKHPTPAPTDTSSTGSTPSPAARRPAVPSATPAARRAWAGERHAHAAAVGDRDAVPGSAAHDAHGDHRPHGAGVGCLPHRLIPISRSATVGRPVGITRE